MEVTFKSRFSKVMAVSSVFCAAQLFSSVALADNNVTLKLSHQNPATSSIHDGAMKDFMKAVEERSGGTIKTEYYPGETLVKASGGLAAARKGVADIQTVVTSYHGDALPVSNLYMLPGAFNTAEAAAESFLKNQAEFIQPELDRLGVKLIGVYIGSPYVMYSHKKIENLADLSGTKVRSPGAVMSNILNQAGASPVSLSAAAMYDAMQKKTVDAAAHTMGYLGDVVKIYETAGSNESFVADAGPGGFGTFVVLMLMGNDMWNKMSPEQQKIVIEEGNKMGMEITKKYDAQDSVGAQRMNDNNVTIVQWDDAARADLQKVIEKSWETEAKKVDDMGFKGTPLVEQFKANKQ